MSETLYDLTPANLEAAFRRAVARPRTQRRAAEILGVSHWHLNRVLNGKRESRRLLAAWEKLQGEGKVG